MSFLFRKKHCRKTSLQPPAPQCPPGSLLKDDECVRVQEDAPRVVCDKGFTLQNNRCIREISVEAELSCPPEAQLIKDKCAVLTSEKPALICPDRFTLADGICKVADVRPAELVCPKGYTADNRTGDCAKSAIVKPAISCERGELRKGECVAVQTAPPELACMSGGMLTPEGCLFADTTPLLQRCPSDSKMDFNGKCSIIDVVEPEYICPPGFAPSGTKKATCERFLTSPASMKCPAGFEPSGMKCMKTAMVEPTATCPEGLVFHQGSCIPYKAQGKKKI